MFLSLLLSVLLAAVAEPQTVMLRGAAQGTTYHIKYVTPRAAIDQQQLQTDVEETLAEIDRQMSTYRNDSEVSRFNRAAADEWFAVSPAVVEVVAAAREISEKTDGAEDVTVGPLVRLWQMRGPKSGKKPARPQTFRPPTDLEIRNARERVGYKKLNTRMKQPALRKEVAGLEVDLSSIAPGYTVDMLSKLLEARGIKDYIVELGGEIRASGKRADGSPWRIAIERPAVGAREMEAAVPLLDAAVATAGGSRHFFEFEGRRYSHVLDPATGRPVEHVLTSVTVAADSCIEADGWDTPLLVMGEERGAACAERNGIAAMFVTRGESGAADEVKTTSAWRTRFGDAAK